MVLSNEVIANAGRFIADAAAIGGGNVLTTWSACSVEPAMKPDNGAESRSLLAMLRTK